MHKNAFLGEFEDLNHIEVIGGGKNEPFACSQDVTKCNKYMVFQEAVLNFIFIEA